MYSRINEKQERGFVSFIAKSSTALPLSILAAKTPPHQPVVLFDQSIVPSRNRWCLTTVSYNPRSIVPVVISSLKSARGEGNVLMPSIRGNRNISCRVHPTQCPDGETRWGGGEKVRPVSRQSDEVSGDGH